MLKTKLGKEYELTRLSNLYQSLSRLVYRKLKKIPSQQRYNITVCNERRFVWFRVAKVGTRTIFNELENNNIVLDAVHPMSVHYPQNLYKNYFKFAFVRNPWDRLCSCWRNKVIDSNYFKFESKELEIMQDFNNFVNFVEKLKIESCDHHLRLQSKLVDLNNIDYLGRFETFSEDLVEVFQNLNINTNEISKKNASKNPKHYHKYYDDKLAEKVYKIYKNDIKIFNYKF